MTPLSGHLATRRTRLRLEDIYYWPSLVDDVKEYCRLCTVCAAQRRFTLRTFLNPLELTNRPFVVLGLDFLGPVTPPSPTGNAYILLITDILQNGLKLYLYQTLPP
jgi:hypothetical protein